LNKKLIDYKTRLTSQLLLNNSKSVNQNNNNNNEHDYSFYISRIKSIEQLKLELIHLNRFEIDNLVELSKYLQPLNNRHTLLNKSQFTHKNNKNNKCKSLLNIKQGNLINIQKDDECTILNQNGNRWKIRTKLQQECQVPSVCFILCSNDDDAFQAAKSLKTQCENLIKQAQSCQLQYKKDRLFNQLNKIKFNKVKNLNKFRALMLCF
jgi:hypothetical protein